MRRDLAAVPCPVGMKKFTTRFIYTLVGVGTEIVALRLQQISGQPVTAIAVIIGKTRKNARNGNAACTNIS